MLLSRSSELSLLIFGRQVCKVDRLPDAGIKGELEDVRPRVVADYIQIVLASRNQTTVQLRTVNRFTLKGRLDQYLSQWINDAGAPFYQHGGWSFFLDCVVGGRAV